MSNQDWRQASPIGMRRYADEYLAVAEDALSGYREKQHPNKRHHTHVPFPIYFNFLHAVELYLKSYMLHTGSDLAELRRQPPRGVGHDLEAALEVCEDRGIKTVCPDLSDMLVDVIKHANAMYKMKEFEYIRVGGAQLAHIDQIKDASIALSRGLSVVKMRPGRP